MKLNELKYNEGSKKDIKRLGRGSSSGTGKTSGRGENGQNSRSGGGVRVGFEGGQLPLYRRLPKRGFSNAMFKKVYAVINVSDLNMFEDGTVVTPELLFEMGIIKKQLAGIKVLGNGEITKKLTVRAHKFSSVAKEKIDTSAEPNFVLPDDGAIVSNMYYGEDDLYAKVWLAADDDNLYMTVEAKDNIHSGTCTDESSIWNDDGIQFAIAQGLPDSGAKYLELGMALNKKFGTVMYCWNDGFGEGRTEVFKGAECKIVRNDKTYLTTYELKLPWSAISPISRDDDMMSFSMLINDNDGMGRTGYLEWGSGIGATKNPGSYRTVLFMK